MAIKKRISVVGNQSAIESLANELADKPYGEDKKNDFTVRTTISLPSSVLFALEDLAKVNKRNKNDLKSVSAIIRNCINNTLKLE